MNKLCIIYNFAQKYREAIYRKIDQNWDCDWYFGKNSTDIKGFDLTALKNAQEVPNKKVFGPFVWQKGIVGLLRNPEYDKFLMLGEFFNLSTWSVILLRPFIAPKKKIYFWSHGWYGREGFGKKWMKRLFFGLVDGTFLYGNYGKEQAVAQGNNPDKLWVLHNSLDYDNQKQLREKLSNSDIYSKHFGNDAPNIIFIGRLTKVKRLDQVIEAVAKLNQDGFPVNLTFIGDGVEAENLKSLVKDKGIEDRVWFYGACYDDTKNGELIYNADLCVAPGNVGLTAMHTMAFGTPVLTHDNFPMQMPEFEAIKKGETGDFFKYGDISSLTEGIKSWLSNHPDRDAVRKACIAEIEESWNPDFQIKVLKNHIE